MIEAINNFSRVAKFPLKQYLIDCENFFKAGYQSMTFFYQGRTNQIKPEYIQTLERLLKEADDISMSFNFHSSKFQNVEYWELLSMLEDLRGNLWTVKNLSKFLRSSRTNFDYNNSFKFDYFRQQNQTLENISEDVLKDSNSENDWVNIAMRNDLKELDYNNEGGQNIKLYKEKFIANFVTSVIDNMIGEAIYGLDLQKRIEFADDDLKVLTHKETVFQCVSILSTLKRGDVPQFPSFGIDPNITVGGNIGGSSYYKIINALSRNFASDDLFINFQVTNIKYEEGDLYVDFQIDTKYKLFVKYTAVL